MRQSDKMDFSKFTIRFSTIFLVLSFVILTYSKSIYTDETRPYKFGFNIEGEQHRRESKDENGIIMGEFGFITADGVYHVTVYATDENGNFKILKMKNIRLGPAPERPPPNATPITEFTTKPPPPEKPQGDQPFTTAKPLPIASCAFCSIPSTTEYTPMLDNRFNDVDSPAEKIPPVDEQLQQDQPPGPQQPQLPDNQLNPPVNPEDQYNPPLVIGGDVHKTDPSHLNDQPQPGEHEGAPPGISTEDMSGLLYRFNYTIGFHGHQEEGYGDGSKKGEYYVNHRNGVATKVSYVANAQGYRPKIETVQITPEETPHPESEKSPQYGLKGYEFKWFYVPKYHHLNNH